MKKLWRKVLAFAFMGVLVSSVGCKDYDDDIDRIDGKLEELSGTVALKTDVQALQQTVNQLNSIDFSAFLRSADFEAKLQQAGVAYKSDLKDWLTGPEVKEMIESYGYQTAEQVKALIDGLQNADDVAATFDAMIKAYDLWGAVSGNVTEAIEAALKEADFMTGESALSTSQVNQLLQTLSAAFGAEGADVKAAIDGWLGQNFAKYMESYEPTEAFIAKLGIGDASIAAVLGELQDANSELVNEVKKLIVDATDGKVSEDTLNTRFGEYDKKIEALSIRVAELEGRIQSLVWVPETTEEVQKGYIDWPTRVTLDLKKEGEKKPKTVVLSESTKTLTWQVTPASVCKKIAPEHVSIVQKSVTRAADAQLEIADVKIDPAEGTIAVTVSTDIDLMAVAEETGENPIIALHVVVPGHKEEGEDGAQYQGIDFLSNYIQVGSDTGDGSSTELNVGNFSIAKGEEVTSWYTFGRDYPITVEYTNKEPQLFLDGVAVYYRDEKDGKKIFINVAETYEAFGEQGALVINYEPELKDGKPVVATVTNEETVGKFLTLTADGFTVKTSDPSLQNNHVYSGNYTCSIQGAKGSEYEGYALKLGTFRMNYRFTRNTIEMTVPDMHFDWNYTDYKDNLYKSKEVSVSGLTVEQYKEAAKAIHEEHKVFFLTLYDADGKVVSSVDAELDLTTTPTADTDVQYAVLKIKDHNVFAKGGEYTAKGEFNLSADCVKVEFPVTVKAMPELNGIAPAAKEYSFDGGYTYELIGVEKDKEENVIDNYITQLWAANKTIVEGQITEKEFADMIKEAVVTSERDDKAELSLDEEGAVNVEFDTNALNDNKSYKPALVFEHASGLTCAIEAQGVKLTKPSVTWIPSTLHIVNGRAQMKTEFKDSTFKIYPENLSAAYTTKENCDLTYSIYNEKDSAQAKALAAMAKAGKAVPTISSDGQLSWNEWNALELIIKVEASKSGVVLGTTTFTAYINDPVGDFAIDAKADNTIYANESKHMGTLVNLLANDPAKRDCFDKDGALNEELAQALTATVKYAKVGEWNPIIELAADGTVTVGDSSIEIAADTNVKVKVTYEYQFGKKETEVTFVVKKGTRPEPAKK